MENPACHIILHIVSCSSRSRNSASAPLDIQPLEPTKAGNLLLELNHLLLITSRISLVLFQSPFEELISVVRLKTLLQNAQSLAIVGNLGPITLNILQILREVGVAALENLTVERRAHDGFEVDVLGPRLLGLGEDEVRGFLHGAHESADFVWVLLDEVFVADVQDGAEAAAAQLGELVDAEHLHVGFGAVLRREPLFQLDHLDVFEADAGVDFLVDDGFGDVHAAADGGVVVWCHAVVGGELVDLNLMGGLAVIRQSLRTSSLWKLYLSELADIADTLALEGAEVGGDTAVFEVDHSGEGFIEERSDRQDREVTSFGLLQ